MPPNEIIAEIHRHREELARRCDFDLHKLVEFLREREAASEAAGRQGVSLVRPGEAAACVVREDSPEV